MCSGIYGGADVAKSPKLVDWDTIKGLRQLSIYQMTHMLKNTANHWQRLVHFRSFEYQSGD